MRFKDLKNSVSFTDIGLKLGVTVAETDPKDTLRVVIV